MVLRVVLLKLVKTQRGSAYLDWHIAGSFWLRPYKISELFERQNAVSTLIHSSDYLHNVKARGMMPTSAQEAA
jgi:hypothetical protein